MRDEISRLNSYNRKINKLDFPSTEMKQDRLGLIAKKYYDFPAIRKASFLPPFFDYRKKDENNTIDINTQSPNITNTQS